jgi:hypothetical protein
MIVRGHMPAKLKLLSLGLAAVSVTAQTNPWALSQPGAKLLMGVDVKSLRESAVGQAIREQMNKVPPSANGVQSPLQGPMQAMAAGLLDQVDRVFVSSSGGPPAVFAASTKNKAPFLLAVEGRFPMGELQPFLKGKTARRYRDADVYRLNPTDVTTFGFIKGAADSSTLLLGDEASVLAAIDRRGGALVPASALLRRAQTLAATHDFWLITDGPLTGFEPTAAAATNVLAAQLAAQVKSLDMGLALRDGFQLEVSVAVESEAVAAQMTQLLSTQIQTALVAQANDPQAAEIARKLHIAAEGNRMQVSIAMTKDEFVQQLLAAQAAQLRAAQAARAQAATASSSRPTPPPVRQSKPANPGQMTIYGLAGGPRVIQSTH